MLLSDSEGSLSHVVVQSSYCVVSSVLLAMVTIAAMTIAVPVKAQDFPEFLEPYGKFKADLKRRGIDYFFGYTSEEATNIRGGTKKRLVHAGQAALRTQFDLDRLVGWEGGTLAITITHRDGQPLNALAHIGSLLGSQEIWGRGNVFRLTQFVLIQELFDGRLSIRLGRPYVGDFPVFPCRFMNLTFCGSPPGNIVYDYWFNWPISQWGGLVKLNVTDSTYLKVGTFQVNPNNLDSDLAVTLDPTGGTGVLIPFEVGWQPTFAGLQQSFVVGGWYSTAADADVYLDVNRNSAARTGLPFLQRDGAYGGYLSFGGQFFRGPKANPASGLLFFFNALLADERTTLVNRTIAGGLVYTGLLPFRPFDELGVGYGVSHLNSRVSNYRRELPQRDPNALPADSNERALEVYYGFQFSNVLQFRPDLQWISHPGGISKRPDALVVGARTTVSF